MFKPLSREEQTPLFSLPCSSFPDDALSQFPKHDGRNTEATKVIVLHPFFPGYHVVGLFRHEIF
ncbi:MAG: hypothetical protein P8Z71_08200, partial [Candidatus Sulfobium sp.]